MRKLTLLLFFFNSSIALSQGSGYVIGGTDQTVIGNVSDKEKFSLFDSSGNSLTIGQKTMANSFPVVISSDQTAYPVNQGTSPWVANISQFGGSNVVTGVGGSGSGIPRVTVADDSTNDANPWFVTQVDTRKSSYSASILGLAPGLLATDVFTIAGSGTKTVRIVKVGISGTEGTASIRDIQLIKRSALDTGGTSTTQTAVPLDSNNAAATATVKAYTANPTALGSAVGTMQTFKIGTPAANVNAGLNPIEFMYGELTQAIVLRGTSENLAVNLNATTVTGASFDIYVFWTEE